MVDQGDPVRDLTGLVVAAAGRLIETSDPWEPYQLLDRQGLVVPAVALYFKELQANESPATTIRSYGMDLLRWLRFLWALDIEWDRAGRPEARDYIRWLQIADKPVRVHWRHRESASAATKPQPQGTSKSAPGTPNPITGKPSLGSKYAATTRAHSETVLQTFYDFHREQDTGPIINPFPLDRSRRNSRPNEHHKWIHGETRELAAIGRSCRSAFLDVSRTTSSTRFSPA